MTDSIPQNSTPSLPEAHASVPVPALASRLKTFLAFAGPGYLVSVGYMDPGNWATDLAGGAKFGYALLWVILLSNLCAMLLQTLCARLGIATGKDLAQACRDYFPIWIAIPLWLLCELAIIAMELAEVIGSAVALQLLFGIPLVWGVMITAFDVLLLMTAMHFGFRKMEAVITALVGTIAFCFAAQIFYAEPDWAGVARGLTRPTLPGGLSGEALALSLGILGATVMPHNLYLHSSLVQTRSFGDQIKDKARAIKYNTLDTIIALGAAFFVNAAILVVAAATFHAAGRFGVSELEEAHKLLSPMLGAPLAATFFAVALLASGQSSTITGTLAGQIVMEGFLRIRVKPWVRRIASRLLAVVPSVILIHATGGKNTTGLLVLSQIVLSMQLPFAIFPLMMFTSDRKKMGEFVNPMWVKIVGYSIALVIAGLNIYLLYGTLASLLTGKS